MSVSTNKRTMDSPAKCLKYTWGFEESSCQKCGATNDDADGLLIQCLLCKKAYYCSRDCFNSDIERHQKMGCRTGTLHRAPLEESPLKQPRGLRRLSSVKQSSTTGSEDVLPIPVCQVVDMDDDCNEEKLEVASPATVKEEVELEKTVVFDEEDEVTFAASADGSRKEEVETDDEEEDFEEESFVSQSEYSEDSYEEIVVSDDEDEDAEEKVHEGGKSISENQWWWHVVKNDGHATKDESTEAETSFTSLPDEVSDGVKEVPSRTIAGQGEMIPVAEREHKPETVALTSVEVEKKQYGWEKPKWNSLHSTQPASKEDIAWQKPSWVTNSPLKRSQRSDIIKQGGSLSRPVTKIAEVVEKGEITWQKPSWTQVQLKPTGKADKMKQGNLAAPITMLPSLVSAPAL